MGKHKNLIIIAVVAVVGYALWSGMIDMSGSDFDMSSVGSSGGSSSSSSPSGSPRWHRNLDWNKF